MTATGIPINRPHIGISSCLLGQPVRFNGGHKKNDWAVEELGKWVDWHPICPEMEMGLGTPRESLRLVRNLETGEIRMQGNASGHDLTTLARSTAERILADPLDIDGYIFKKESPSCGLERVKVYGKNNIPDKSGSGIFATLLKDRYPAIPLVEEGRLCDPEQREHFVTQVFGLHRLRSVGARVSEIQRFHQNHKFLLLAHSPAHYQRLGQIAANSDAMPAADVLRAYRIVFAEALATPSSRSRRVNVLQHLFGFFKSKLERNEKREILEAIDEYQAGELPLMAPVRLIHYLVARYSQDYLDEQVFFAPYPKSLGLRKFL